VKYSSGKTDLQNLLKRQQITPSNFFDEREGPGNLTSAPSRQHRLEGVAIFTRQFSVMIDAGLPPWQCLEILAGQARKQDFSEGADHTREMVEGGSTLSAP